MKRICENCEWFTREVYKDHHGFCHADRPTMDGFPRVCDNDKCPAYEDKSTFHEREPIL